MRIARSVLGLIVFLTGTKPSTSAPLYFPEPHPPSIRTGALLSSGPGARSEPSLAGPPVLYFCGEPTDLEQQYLEYINRARANPMGEALFLAAPTDPAVLAAYAAFKVDTNLLLIQFGSLQPAQPLAMNPILLAAGRQHSGWMFTNEVQSHSEGALSTAQRLLDAGYNWKQGGTVGENIFAYASSVIYGHIGFNTDWGGKPQTGGMQSPPGHRLNIHDPVFREIGVGLVLGQKGSVGPQLVTEEFGTLNRSLPFVTGVAYYDLNGNRFYDPGEGLSGIRVEVEGADHYAITSQSGGYAVPVRGSGSRLVRFLGGGFVATEQAVLLSGAQNVKVDFIPPYLPPGIEGPTRSAQGELGLFRHGEVAGAIGYQLRSASLTPLVAVEGAENGLAGVVVDVSGYPPIADDVAASGDHSFHLVQPSPPRAQSVQLKASFRPGTSGSLSFYARLGWATSKQVARAQVSSDGGGTWTDLWSQAGTDNEGQTGFTRVTRSLADFAGEELLVRFLYETKGSHFPQTDSGVGLYVDDISFEDTDALTQVLVQSIPDETEFERASVDLGRGSLQVRALLTGRELPWGAAFFVEVLPTLPAIVIQMEPVVDAAIDARGLSFRVLEGEPSFFLLEEADSPSGTWRRSIVAQWEEIEPRVFRFVFSAPLVDSRFYRVRAQ